jgi:hypothetical protein
MKKLLDNPLFFCLSVAVGALIIGFRGMAPSNSSLSIELTNSGSKMYPLTISAAGVEMIRIEGDRNEVPTNIVISPAYRGTVQGKIYKP